MLTEGKELRGESGKTYEAVSSLGQPNVWVAVEKGNNANIVVLKEPDAHDPVPWPRFQHEMIMHELFKNCPSIRKQVDRIPPTDNGGLPTLVLEMFETTVWTARTKRPFTSAETKAICKAALIGLRDVHNQGLVYADLKMENIMLNGFDVHEAGDSKKLVTKLGDLGIVMPPANGQVQPVVYRAPEVHFKGEITSKADIWSFGLIYCHLLEAHERFSDTGLYDDLDVGSGTLSERLDAVRFAIANDYEVHGDAYYRNVSLPRQDRRGKGNQWEELRSRGLEQAEVDFLRWVMRVDPRKRPSAKEILATGWLDKTEEQVKAEGFPVPISASGHATIEYDPRRPVQRRNEKRTSRMNEVTENDETESANKAARTDGESGTWTDTLSNLPGVSTLMNTWSSNPTTSDPPASETSNTSNIPAGAQSGPWVPSTDHSSQAPASTSNNTNSTSTWTPSGHATPGAYTPSIAEGTPWPGLSPHRATNTTTTTSHASTPALSPGVTAGAWSGVSPGTSPHRSQPLLSRQPSEAAGVGERAGAAAVLNPPPLTDAEVTSKRSSAQFVAGLMSSNATSPGMWNTSGAGWLGSRHGSVVEEAEEGVEDGGDGYKKTAAVAVRPGMPARSGTGSTYLSYR